MLRLEDAREMVNPILREIHPDAELECYEAQSRDVFFWRLPSGKQIGFTEECLERRHATPDRIRDSIDLLEESEHRVLVVCTDSARFE